MRTKKLRLQQFILGAACVLVLAATTLLVVQGTSAYTRYSDAFNNLPQAVKYIDLDTSVRCTADGRTVAADANLQLDNGGSRLMYTGTVDGVPFTQFTDGSYMYLDYKWEKTKYQFGTASPLEDTADFSVDNYIRNFVSLIDEQSFMQLGLLWKMNNRDVETSNGTTPQKITGMSRSSTPDGYKYRAALTDSAKNALFNAITSVQTDWEQWPSTELISMDYTMYADSGNVVKRMVIDLSFTVTFDEEATGGSAVTKTVDIQAGMVINSINKALYITIPSTEDYEPNFEIPDETDNGGEEIDWENFDWDSYDWGDVDWDAMDEGNDAAE